MIARRASDMQQQKIQKLFLQVYQLHVQVHSKNFIVFGESLIIRSINKVDKTAKQIRIENI